MSTISRADCEALDAADTLAPLRDEFALPEGVIYLDGNSLGARPRAAAARAAEVVEREWGEGLIRSWNEAGWWQAPTRLGDKLGALIGAAAGQVVVTDTVAVNLYKVLAAALAQRPQRRVILMERSNFPTDNYIAQGLLQQLGGDYRVRFAEHAELPAALDDSVAVLCLTHVHYKTGRIHPMRELTRQAHAVGALAVWDLSHSAGALELALDDCGVDYAVGCSYKYLNGGPGAPGWVYVNAAQQGRAQQPLTGWWGHAQPFAFEPDYRPDPGVRQMLCGTQGVVGMALAEVGLDLCARAPMAEVRAKSSRLTRLFIDLVEQRCADHDFGLASPRADAERGSQVSFAHGQGYAIVQALIARGVIGDFRAPDILRFGFAPLYIRYIDVWDAVEQLRQVMRSSEWQRPEFNRRSEVT